MILRNLAFRCFFSIVLADVVNVISKKGVSALFFIYGIVIVRFFLILALFYLFISSTYSSKKMAKPATLVRNATKLLVNFPTSKFM